MFAYEHEDIFLLRKQEIERDMKEVERILNLEEYHNWITSTRARAIIGIRAPISAHNDTIEVSYFLARALHNVYDRKLEKDHDLPEDNYLPWERRRIQ